MGVPERIQLEYAKWLPSVEELSSYVSDTIRPWADDRGWPFVSRIKTMESLSEKLEMGRWVRWSQIDDLLACSIIVPTQKEESEAIEFLRTAFREVSRRGRTTARMAPDVFRFDATRWYGRAHVAVGSGLSEDASSIVFEVQIPTAFEHAWSVATHDLTYKGDGVDWQRLHLAAVLKANVEQLDLLVSTFDDTASSIPASGHGPTESVRKAVRVMKRLIDDRLIPRELEPSSWARFADSVVRLASLASREEPEEEAYELVQRLAAAIADGSVPSPPVSGSLMQLVLAFFVQERDLDTIVDYPVVTSQELAILHGLRVVPLEFDFDC